MPNSKTRKGVRTFIGAQFEAYAGESWGNLLTTDKGTGVVLFDDFVEAHNFASGPPHYGKAVKVIVTVQRTTKEPDHA